MWSYSHNNTNAGYADYEVQATWTNHWTVEQAETTTSGTYRLKFVVETDSFSQWPTNYEWTCTDSLAYGGETVTVHAATRVTSAYGYTAYVNVPGSWKGKSVQFRIADLKQSGYFNLTLNVVGPPTITSHPSNVTTSASTATFKVTATGAESYQWQFRTSSSGTWANITNSAYSGITTATLSVPTSGRSGYQYRCKVTNAAGTVYSNSATLTVEQTPAQTPSVVSCDGGNIGSTIAVSLTGVPSGAKHTVTVSRSGTVIQTLLTNSSSTSVSWTPSASTYASYATSARLDVTVKCETFVNGSSIGQTSRIVYLNFVAGSFSASTITAANGNFGTAVSVGLTRAFSSTKIKHTLSVTCAGQSSSLLSASTSTSTSWPAAGADYAPYASAATVNATFTCETWFYDVKIGTATKTISMSFTAGSFAASTITASNGLFGTANSIGLNRAASTTKIKHTLSVTVKNSGGTTIGTESLLSDSTATSKSWTPSTATYAASLTSASATATFSCTTLYYGVTIGTTTKVITLSVGAGSFEATSITASNGTFGSSIPITLTRGLTNSNVKHTLKVVCAERTTSLLTKSTSLSANWAPAGADYAPIVSGSSVTATISCDTYFYDTKIGTKTKTITVSFTAGSITPSAISASNGSFGSQVSVSLTTYASGVKHILTRSCLNYTATMINNTTATSATWTPPIADYAARIPTETSATATFTCETYFAGVLMGTTTKTITLSLPASVKPSIESDGITVAPRNTDTAAAGMSGYVQGYSKARVTFVRTKIAAGSGATVSKYAIRFKDTTTEKNYNSSSNVNIDTATLGETSATIVCTVTDSRGRTATKTLTISVQGYTSPSLSSIQVIRTASATSTVSAEDGTYIRIKATATITSLGGENSIQSFGYQYKPSGGSWQPVTPTAMTSGTWATMSANADVSYTIRITLTDALGNTATATRTIPSQKWAMKFRPDGNGVAFGKNAELSNALEIPEGWKIMEGGKDYLGGVRLLQFNIVDGNYATLAFPNATSAAQSGMIFSSGLYLAGRGVIAYTNYNGNTYSTVLAGASGLTISSSGNELTITNDTSARVVFCIMALSGSLPEVIKP